MPELSSQALLSCRPAGAPPQGEDIKGIQKLELCVKGNSPKNHKMLGVRRKSVINFNPRMREKFSCSHKGRSAAISVEEFRG